MTNDEEEPGQDMTTPNSAGIPVSIALGKLLVRTLEAECAAPPGIRDAPLICEALLEKALDCFKVSGLAEDAARRLATMLVDGPSETPIADVLAATTPSPGPAA